MLSWTMAELTGGQAVNMLGFYRMYKSGFEPLMQSNYNLCRGV
jgi:hypothetical protein